MKMLQMILAMIGFGAIGTAMMYLSHKPYIFIMGMLAFGFFVGGGLFYLYKTTTAKVELRETGIYDTSTYTSFGLIRFQDITEANFLKQNIGVAGVTAEQINVGVDVLALKLRNPKEYIDQLSFWKKPLYSTLLNYDTSINYTAPLKTLSKDDLAKAIRERSIPIIEQGADITVTTNGTGADVVGLNGQEKKMFFFMGFLFVIGSALFAAPVALLVLKLRGII